MYDAKREVSFWAQVLETYVSCLLQAIGKSCWREEATRLERGAEEGVCVVAVQITGMR